MPDPSEWMDDYCQQWKYDEDLRDQANDMLAIINTKEKDE